MVTVVLIGADGAGKATIGSLLEKESTLPMKYIYMGVNLESGNHTLPTTRMILKIKRASGKSSQSNLRIAHQLGEEWFRQCLAWHLARKLGDKLKKAMQSGRRNDVNNV